VRILLLALALTLAMAGCARTSTPTPSSRLWSAEALADLKDIAESAPAEGLAPEQTALAEIARFEHLAGRDSTAALQADIAADALFSSLARSFAQGGADPAHADPEWRIPSPPTPDIEALLAARAAGASPSSLLLDLLPRAPEYRAMRDELARTITESPGALDAHGLDRDTRLIRLRANMERWRWLPRHLPEQRIEARIAQFETILRRPGVRPLVHAAIVGARRTPTPSFSASIVSVTLNPTWQPPLSILHNELLPRFRRDPAAAERENFDVIDSRGNVIDPTSVDWGARPFLYLLRQRPGPGNALGQIRFDLPNPFSIYLHDTSNRSLFSRTDRALSHGCIRVENTLGLAEAVIADPAWDLEALQTAIAEGETKTIGLPTSMSIYVLYLTASASEGGTVTYFDDLYHRDAAVVAALDAPDVAVVAAPALVQRCAAPTMPGD
jgi:murein L,D-transpeptidase YcbB/YkuD